MLLSRGQITVWYFQEQSKIQKNNPTNIYGERAIAYPPLQLLLLSIERKAVLIDIKLRDVVAGAGIISQATAFGYKNGIRDVYIGTDFDPWRDER